VRCVYARQCVAGGPLCCAGQSVCNAPMATAAQTNQLRPPHAFSAPPPPKPRVSGATRPRPSSSSSSFATHPPVLLVLVIFTVVKQNRFTLVSRIIDLSTCLFLLSLLLSRSPTSDRLPLLPPHFQIAGRFPWMHNAAAVVPGRDCSPTSPQSSHHQSMSTLSTSPSSVSAEDHYQFVDEADEIVLPVASSGYYPENIASRRPPASPNTLDWEHFEQQDSRRRSFTLWKELERDGADTSVIPSFILESPPMGPLRNVEDVDYLFAEQHGGHTDVSIHSLRKGTSSKAPLCFCSHLSMFVY